MSTIEIASLLDNSKDLDRLRKEQEDVLLEINKIHKKLQTTPEMAEKSVDALLLKLRALYVQAKELSENEWNVSNALVGQLDALLQSGLSAAQRKKIGLVCPMRGFHGLQIYLFSWERKILLPTSSISLKSRKISLFFPSLKGKHVAPNNRIVGCMENQSNFLSIAESCHRTSTPLVTEVNEQKKKRMKADSDLSRLSPAASMRSQLEQAASLKGEQVAARVTPDNAEKDEWFVVKVIHFDREAKEFEVLDEEPGDDEESVQRKYKLPMSRIIPFPKRGDPSSAPDFPHGRPVLAVYPGTTALYKATVVNNRKRKTDEYLLEFDDDEEDGSLPQRNVPFYRVVPLPEGHRQ